MSCWKCGKTLPEGQVECEDGCQSQAYKELMALADPPEEEIRRCLVIELPLDKKQVESGDAE